MITVGITGASGPIIGIRLIEELINSGEAVAAVVSDGAVLTMRYELDINYTSMRDLILQRKRCTAIESLKEYDNNDFCAPMASGSSDSRGIIVAPTSMKTLSSIANGYSDNLITRACDVSLKEKRTCILVPRETPLNLIHIENMKRAVLAGAIIVPPIPGFYSKPKTADDIIDFIVGKILNAAKISHSLFESWETIIQNQKKS